MASSLRPQLTKLILPYVKEAAYGTEVADGSITKRFDTQQADLADITQESADDSDMIKGHEFNRDSSSHILVNQEGMKPFNFWASPELGGLIIAAAHGAISTASGPPQVHTITSLNAATSDQLPSISLLEAVTGDTATYWKMKGVVVADYKLSCQNKGKIMLTGNFMTDGSMTAKTGFSVPTTQETQNYLIGTNALLKIVNAGGSLVDISSLLRGFEVGWDNALDKADMRGQIASGSPYATSARFGSRKQIASFKIWGNKGDAYWIDYLAQTLKYVQLSLVSGATSIVYDFTRCKLVNMKSSFDGIRNVLSFDLMPYSTTTTTFTPATIAVTNLVAGYLT